MPSTLELEERSGATWIWMNRAEKHNAFDEILIAELSEALLRVEQDPNTRVVVLAGRGKSFSAGGDLNWMKRQAIAPFDENTADALRMAELFRRLAELRQPTIARVHGAAMGGGLGLAAACDICVASTDASFATSEVKLGIIPAAISPYVVRAIGERQCYRYFQTAERIGAMRARELGLAHEVVDASEIDQQVQSLVDALQSGGPLAQTASTELLRAVANRPRTPELIAGTASRIARLRTTPEAAEGLSAFLGKRKPLWFQ